MGTVQSRHRKDGNEEPAATHYPPTQLSPVAVTVQTLGVGLVTVLTGPVYVPEPITPVPLRLVVVVTLGAGA